MLQLSRIIAFITCILVFLSEVSAELILKLDLSTPRGISADGSIVTGRVSDLGGVSGQQAFRWTRESGMEGLGDLSGGAFSSGAAAISADGSTIVGVGTTERGEEAFAWNASQGMTRLGSLPGGNASSLATSVSEDGSTIVGTSRNDGPFATQATIWNGGIVGLGDLPGGGRSSNASGVSADGSVVVGISRSNRSSVDQPEAFRWTAEGGMVGLGHLPGGGRSAAHAISSDGRTIVGQSTGTPISGSNPFEAFMWTEETGMTGLGFLDGYSLRSSATAVSADGSVITGDVGFGNDSLTRSAFYWTEQDGMTSVEDLILALGAETNGWAFHTVTGLSADGRIFVGEGVAPNGDAAGYIVNLDGFATSAAVPEPNSVGILAFALIAICSIFRLSAKPFGIVVPQQKR